MSYIYDTTFNELKGELIQIERDNLNDLGDQILLNYRVFREHVVVKNLNLTTDIMQEALFPKLLVPYPLDFTQQKF